MNKDEIKKELRRSACEDENPYDQAKLSAFLEVVYWSDWPMRSARFLYPDEMRTFFLIVAEAL